MNIDDRIEHDHCAAGWAVMSGCEGEDFHFHAFFADRDRACDYLTFVTGREKDDDFRLLDGDTCVVPAIVVGGELLIGNTYDEREVMNAMAGKAELSPAEWRAWLAELPS